MAYRIIKDAEDHYQVMHPDGSRFTVPKKGISKQMHEKIQGMPKLFEGGDVPEKADYSKDNGIFTDDQMAEMARVKPSVPATPFDEEIQTIQDRLNRPNSMGGEEAVPLAEKLGKLKTAQQAIIDAKRNPPAPEPAPAQQLNQEAPKTEIPATETKAPEAPKAPEVKTPDQQAPGAPIEPVKTGIPGVSEIPGMPKIDAYSGERMMRQAATDYNNAVKAHETKLQNDAEAYETSKANDQKEIQDFLNSHQIQQGHYWGSMTTGGRVMSGIALALGGLGAGMTKGPNYALQIINKAIEDDLEAQKENRNSGLNALIQKGKDRDTIYNNYRANTIQKIQDQNNLYTAQAKTAEARQAGQTLDMKLQEMKANALAQADTKQAMNYLYNKGIPTKMIPTGLLIDDKVRQQLVDVDGTSYMYKGRPEGAEIHNKMEANFRPIRDAILELKSLGPAALNKFTAEGQRARAIADMLPNAVAGFYSSAIDSKRISDTEGHRAESALSDPSSFLQAVIGDNVKGMTVLHEMQNIIDSSRKQMLSGYEETPRPAGAPGMSSGPQKLPLNKVK